MNHNAVTSCFAAPGSNPKSAATHFKPLQETSGTYLKELPKPLQIQATQRRQILLHPPRIHTHPPQFSLSQPRKILPPSLGVNRLLQACCFTEDLLALRVSRIKGWLGGHGPAERGEPFHHEAIEAGEGRLRGSIGDDAVAL